MASRIRRIRNEFATLGHSQCFMCSKDVSAPRALYMHALVPLTKGGALELSNLVPACAKCHTALGDKTLKEFLDERIANAQRRIAAAQLMHTKYNLSAQLDADSDLKAIVDDWEA